MNCQMKLIVVNGSLEELRGSLNIPRRAGNVCTQVLNWTCSLQFSKHCCLNFLGNLHKGDIVYGSHTVAQSHKWHRWSER